jgi:hypothetical protein
MKTIKSLFFLPESHLYPRVRLQRGPGHRAFRRPAFPIRHPSAAAGKAPVSVGGENAHNPVFILFLIGVGIRRRSVDCVHLPAAQRKTPAVFQKASLTTTRR